MEKPVVSRGSEEGSPPKKKDFLKFALPANDSREQKL